MLDLCGPSTKKVQSDSSPFSKPNLHNKWCCNVIPQIYSRRKHVAVLMLANFSLLQHGCFDATMFCFSVVQRMNVVTKKEK